MKRLFMSSAKIIVKEGDHMLVLGRKPGEYVIIGKDIMVKVVRSVEGDLRLAIDAPKNVNILRGEVYERNNKLATNEMS